VALSGHTSWADWVVRRRAPVQVALLVAVLACLAALPSLETRFDPAELVAADAQVRADVEHAGELFGTVPDGIVVLLDGREGGVDLLATPELARTHRLAMRLGQLEGVRAVHSLTTTPLPTRQLDDDQLGNLEDLEDLEDLDAAQDPDDDAVLGWLQRIAAADPERFPGGVLSIESGEIRVRALGAGAELTEAEAERARAVHREMALIRRRLASEDGRVVVVVVEPRPELDVQAQSALLSEVRARLEAEPPRPGVTVATTGIPAMRAEMIAALRTDQGRLVLLATLGALLVLTLGMRSLAGVVLPLATVGISVVLAMGLMVATGTPINLLTNMLPPLLLTIGLAEAMHMVVRYRDELVAGAGRVEAAVETLRSMWLACFVTTFTTAVGFGALVLQESEGLRRFGWISAVATMLTYVVTIVFVPAWLPSFGVPHDRAIAEHGGGRLDRWLVAVGRRMARGPWGTIVLASVLTAGAAWVSQDLVVESRLLDQFADDSEVARASLALEEELDGFRALDLVIEGQPGVFGTVEGMALLDAVTAEAASNDGVLRATSAADWARDADGRLGGAPSAARGRFVADDQVSALLDLVAHGDAAGLRRYVTDDRSAVRVEIRLVDHGASRTLAMVERLRGIAVGAGAVRATAVGEAFVSSRGLERIVTSLGSLAAAVVTIFVVMTLLFRSVRLGLLAIPPNVLPLLLTVAYMVWRGIPLHAATVIVFTVTVGLAVDGTTHVVARYREELEKGGTREEVLLRTVAGSGRPVLLSSLTLVVGYLVLLSSTFEPVRLFGELSAVAIAASTVSQTFLLPALLAVAAPGPAQIERRPSSDEVNAPSSGK
jgi:predicted RND superfamily exporter protein